MATLFIFPKKPKNAYKLPLSLYMRFYNKQDLYYINDDVKTSYKKI